MISKICERSVLEEELQERLTIHDKSTTTTSDESITMIKITIISKNAFHIKCTPLDYLPLSPNLMTDDASFYDFSRGIPSTCHTARYFIDEQ